MSLMSTCFPRRSTSGCFFCMSHPTWAKKNPRLALWGSASVSLNLWWTLWSLTQSKIEFCQDMFTYSKCTFSGIQSKRKPLCLFTRLTAMSCEWEISVCPGIVPSISSNICLPVWRIPQYLLIHCDFQIYATSYRGTGNFHSTCTGKRVNNLREIVLHYYNELKFEERSVFIYDSLWWYVLRLFSRNCEKRLLALSCMSVFLYVRPGGKLGSQQTDFHEIWFRVFSDNLSRKSNFHYNFTKIADTLHENQCTIMAIFLRMRNVSDKMCRGNRNTRFVFNKFCLSKFVLFMRWYGKNFVEWAGHRWQNGACALHAGFLSL
jgi:hypothetical protein